jgi:hypothetical protein
MRKNFPVLLAIKGQNRKDDDGKHFSCCITSATKLFHIKGKFSRQTMFHSHHVFQTGKSAIAIRLLLIC